MNRAQPRRRPCKGFTLIEMSVATAVAGVLASVAYPSFSSTLQKVRRSEALVATVQLQTAQERWRSTNSRYGTLAELGVASTVPGRNYVLSVSEPSAQGYVAVAQATGLQAGDRACRYMKLTVDGGNTVYSSGETEATTNNAQGNRQCWNL